MVTGVLGHVATEPSVNLALPGCRLLQAVKSTLAWQTAPAQQRPVQGLVGVQTVLSPLY